MGKTGSVLFFFATWASACGRLKGRRQEAEVRGVSRAEDHHFLERILLFFSPSRSHSSFLSRSGSYGKTKGNVFSLFSHSRPFSLLFFEEHGSYCGLTITQMVVKITTWPDAQLKIGFFFFLSKARRCNKHRAS